MRTDELPNSNANAVRRVQRVCVCVCVLITCLVCYIRLLVHCCSTAHWSRARRLSTMCVYVCVIFSERSYWILRGGALIRGGAFRFSRRRGGVGVEAFNCGGRRRRAGRPVVVHVTPPSRHPQHLIIYTYSSHDHINGGMAGRYVIIHNNVTLHVYNTQVH